MMLSQRLDAFGEIFLSQLNGSTAFFLSRPFPLFSARPLFPKFVLLPVCVMGLPRRGANSSRRPFGQYRALDGPPFLLGVVHPPPPYRLIFISFPSIAPFFRSSFLRGQK